MYFKQTDNERLGEATEIKLVKTTEIQDDASNVLEVVDWDSTETVPFINKDDATDAKLDEMMNNLLEFLDETIDILKVVDEDSSTDDNDEDDDSGYHYIVRGYDRKYLNETGNVNDETALVLKSYRNESVSEIEVEINNFEVTKNNGKFNEFADSFFVVCMLVGLYFLISFLV